MRIRATNAIALLLTFWLVGCGSGTTEPKAGVEIATHEAKCEALIEPLLLSDEERQQVLDAKGSTKRFQAAVKMVMGKNPMSIRAFRIGRPRMQAFHLLARIADPLTWGDRAEQSKDFLAFTLTELDGTEGGMAVVRKRSPEGEAMFEATKDGKDNTVIVVLQFHEPFTDPEIVYVK